MQLVLHAPFGSRINKAWGLALRKRFCRQFNFELQAAATEDALLLSLGPQHSFPLADVFRYLHPATARDVLVQALLDAPVFQTRWRWNTTISLAVPRIRGGRKVPPQLQRMQADDLMAAGVPRRRRLPREHSRRSRRFPIIRSSRRRFATASKRRWIFDGLDRRARRAFTPASCGCVTRDTPEPSPLRARDPQRAAVRVPGRCAARRAADAGRVRRAARREPQPASRVSARSMPPPSSACATRCGPTRATPTNCTTRWSPADSLDGPEDRRRRARGGARPMPRRAPGAALASERRFWSPPSGFRRSLAVHPGASLEPSIAAPPGRAARAWTRDDAIVELAARTPLDRRSDDGGGARRVRWRSPSPMRRGAAGARDQKAPCCAVASRRGRDARSNGATGGCSRAFIATR